MSKSIKGCVKMNKPKVFDDFPEADCNGCEHWWTNQCDGVFDGSQRPCSSYLPTREIVIPAQIKTLQSAVQWLIGAVALLTVAVICLGVICLM